MANGDDVRLTADRGLSDPLTLRSPRLRYRPKKPKLRAGRLKLDLAADDRAPRAPQLKLPPAKLEASRVTNSHPTLLDRALSIEDRLVARSFALTEPRWDIRNLDYRSLGEAASGFNENVFTSKTLFRERKVRLEDQQRRDRQWEANSVRERSSFEDWRNRRPSKDPYNPVTVAGEAADKIRQAKAVIARETGKDTLVLAIAMQETSTLTSEYVLGDTYPSLLETLPTSPQLKSPTLDARGTQYRRPLGPTESDYDLAQRNLALAKAVGPWAGEHFPKTGPAANYGIYKMNWYMIERTPLGERLAGLASSDPKLQKKNSAIQAAVGKLINDDRTLATRILMEAMRKWDISPPDPLHPTKGNFWAGHRWGGSGLSNTSDADWSDIQDYYRSVQEIKFKCDHDPNVWESADRHWHDVPAI
jgi:hypothetical protein